MVIAEDLGVDLLAEEIERLGLEFVLAMFVDMGGKPCAKLIPASALETLRSGAGFAGFAAGALAQRPSDPDLIAVPDPGSFFPAPWRPGLGVVMCDLVCEGEPWPYAPRVILKRQLEQLATRGWQLKCGVEAEYFLVRRDPDGRLVVADSADDASSPCYDAIALTRSYDHLVDVSRHLNDLGFGNYANDHEDANGQFEQNFDYAGALETADRLIFFRFMVRALAEQRGLMAAFMPKPFTHLTGNGLHIHTSLWDDDGTELFQPGLSDDRGLGLSDLGYAFAGGLLEHSPALTAVCCPTVNSYKRLEPVTPSSGASWTPTRVTLGGNDRTNLLRVPEPGRIEYRCPDGAANPYLAFSAMLAAGLDGIDRGIDPDPAEQPTLPPTLLHASEALVADDVLRAGLGTGRRGDYVDYMASVQQEAFRAWHSEVSDWELHRYLKAF